MLFASALSNEATKVRAITRPSMLGILLALTPLADVECNPA
jgi:hypothetical protein